MQLAPLDDGGIGLDSFFATHTNGVVDHSLPGNILAQLNSSPPECPNYEELRKQLYEVGLDKEKHEETTTLNEKMMYILPISELEELKEIQKYTRKGFDILSENIKKYLELTESIAVINKDIDRIYKSRNDVIGNIRSLTKGAFVDQVSDISANVENLIASMKDCKEKEKANLEASLDNVKTILAFLNDTYKIHKHAHSYITCPICMQNEVAMYMIPCGHAYCDKGCASKMSRCAVCNTSISTRGRLYI